MDVREQRVSFVVTARRGKKAGGPHLDSHLRVLHFCQLLAEVGLLLLSLSSARSLSLSDAADGLANRSGSATPP